MSSNNHHNQSDDLLAQARQMSTDAYVPEDDPEFSLEEILTEYGSSREQKLMRDVERAAAPEAVPEAGPADSAPPAGEPEEPPPAEDAAPPGAAEPDPREADAAREPPSSRKDDGPPADFPEPPRPISMEEVVEHTVDAVRQEQKQRKTRPRKKKRPLPRRVPRDTEELYQRPPSPPKPEPEEEPIGPEPPLSEAASHARHLEKQLRAPLFPAAVLSALLAAGMILFGRHVVALFISADAANAAEALSVAYDYLVVMSTFLLSAYVLHTYRSALQGMGFTTAPMLSGLTEFAGRVGASLLLTRVIGERGLFYTDAAAWTFAAVFLAASYYIQLFIIRIKGLTYQNTK